MQHQRPHKENNNPGKKSRKMPIKALELKVAGMSNGLSQKKID